MRRVCLKVNNKQNGTWESFHSFEKGLNCLAQSAFTFSKLKIETLEQGVKYVQS